MSSLLRTKYSPEKVCESFFTNKQIQVTEDGEHIFCQCSFAVTIVETKSGNVVGKIEQEEDEVFCSALSPDETSISIGYGSSNVRHYKINDYSAIEPKIEATFKSYCVGPVTCMSWDSTSTLLATGGSDGSARVWDLEKKYCTHSLKNANGVFRIIFFHENLYKRPWVYGAANENIYVWVMKDGESELLSTLSGHNSTITGLQLGHSVDDLISCGLDKVIILWDLKTFTSKKIIPLFESLSGIILKPLDYAFYNADEDLKENIVFTIGSKGLPSIWNVDKGKELWRASNPISPPCETEQLYYHVSFLKSKDSFVISTYDNVILFLHCHSMNVWKQFVGENEDILDLILLGKEDRRFTAVAANGIQIRMYENETNNCRLISGHSGTVFALANHPVDNYVFGSSSHDNTARLWRLKEDGNCVCLAIAEGHVHTVGCLDLARDFLITGSDDTCIKRWNFNLKDLSAKRVTNLSSVRTQRAHSKALNSVAVSKTGKLIASASKDNVAKIWDASTLDEIGTLVGHKKGIWCVKFSPTDAIVATSSADSTIKLWSLNDHFTMIRSLEARQLSVMKIAWASQGQQIISCDADGLINIWTIKNSVRVACLDEHDKKLWALTTADDGSVMVTGGADSKIIWWKDVTEEEKEKELKEKQKQVEGEQTLMNLMQEKKWAKAVRYAIRLKQPARGLTIIRAILDDYPDRLPSALKGLRNDELSTLFEYVIQWNTRTATEREASEVLYYFMKTKLPEELEQIPNWESIAVRIKPYADKHTKMAADITQGLTILKFVLFQMGLEPLNDPTHEADERELLKQISTTKPRIKNYVVKDDDDKDESSSSDDESIEHDDDYNDLEGVNAAAPLESVEDIRSNFVYERIMADTDSDDDDERMEVDQEEESCEDDDESEEEET